MRLIPDQDFIDKGTSFIIRYFNNDKHFILIYDLPRELIANVINANLIFTSSWFPYCNRYSFNFLRFVSCQPFIPVGFQPVKFVSDHHSQHLYIYIYPYLFLPRCSNVVAILQYSFFFLLLTLPFRSSFSSFSSSRVQRSFPLPFSPSSLFFLNKENKLRGSTPLLIEENSRATRSEIRLRPRWIKRMIQTRYIYIRRVDQRLMNDDDITREMHSGRLVGMQQFSDISQTDAANSIYAPLDNLLGGKLDRHRWEIANYRSLFLDHAWNRSHPLWEHTLEHLRRRRRRRRGSDRVDFEFPRNWSIEVGSIDATLITDYPSEELEQVCNKEFLFDPWIIILSEIRE